MRINNNIFNNNIKQSRDINIGDSVRVIKKNNPFNKEGITFSTKIYTVSSLDKNKYKVSGQKGIKNMRYKYHELMKVNKNNVEKPIELINVKKANKDSELIKDKTKNDKKIYKLKVEKRIKQEPYHTKLNFAK